MRHVVVMVTTSYPRFPGDGVGQLHRTHRQRRRRARTRSASRRALASGAESSEGRRRRPLPLLPLRAGRAAQRLRLRQRASRGHAAPPCGVDDGAARDGQRRLENASRGAETRRDCPARALGHPGRRDRRAGVRGSAAGREHPRVGHVRRRTQRRGPDGRAVRAAAGRLGDRLQRGSAPARHATSAPTTRAPRRCPMAWIRRASRQTRACATRSAGELGLAMRRWSSAAGRLVRKKGFEHLIDAAGILAASFPNLTVVIAGEGDLRDELHARRRYRGAGSRPPARVSVAG